MFCLVNSKTHLHLEMFRFTQMAQVECSAADGAASKTEIPRNVLTFLPDIALSGLEHTVVHFKAGVHS